MISLSGWVALEICQLELDWPGAQIGLDWVIWGDVKVLTDGVYEMREKFGPGWRMYYVLRGKTIIVMLGGGDKSSQASDIKAAKKLAKLLED